MISNWYAGDFAVVQPWGCTDYTAEPYDPNCPSKHFHRGVDIALPLNTPLKAAVACELTQVGYDPNGFGPHYPILRLPDGTQFLIGHTSSVVAGIGPLQQGAVFAYSGNEGMSTGPHAHFQANASPGDFTNTKDPVPYVELGLEDDLTPEEHQWLQQVYNYTTTNDPASPTLKDLIERLYNTLYTHNDQDPTVLDLIQRIYNYTVAHP